MTALVYLKSGRVEVLEDLQDVNWGEYEVKFERYSHGWAPAEPQGLYHPSQIVKVELVP